MKKTGYYVIGKWHCYGHKTTLHAAKLLAAVNKEYWGNYLGLQTPKIYAAEDCSEIESDEFNYHLGGCVEIVPKYGLDTPIAAFRDDSGKWITPNRDDYLGGK